MRSCGWSGPPPRKPHGQDAMTNNWSPSPIAAQRARLLGDRRDVTAPRSSGTAKPKLLSFALYDPTVHTLDLAKAVSHRSSSTTSQREKHLWPSGAKAAG